MSTRNNASRRIVEWVVAHPGCTRAQLLAGLGVTDLHWAMPTYCAAKGMIHPAGPRGSVRYYPSAEQAAAVHAELVRRVAELRRDKKRQAWRNDNLRKRAAARPGQPPAQHPAGPARLSSAARCGAGAGRARDHCPAAAGSVGGMSDDLIARLRSRSATQPQNFGLDDEAADRIEAQAARIAALELAIHGGRICVGTLSGEPPRYVPECVTATARIAELETALFGISLCSQNSMSDKKDCGRLARAALAPKIGTPPTDPDYECSEEFLRERPSGDAWGDGYEAGYKAGVAESKDPNRKLADFGAWAAEEFRQELGDVDGGSAQDAMLRLGVLETVTVTEPCGECCRCAEYGDWPMECNHYPEDVRRTIAAAQEPKP